LGIDETEPAALIGDRHFGTGGQGHSGVESDLV
jgi:hypothetical protein